MRTAAGTHAGDDQGDLCGHELTGAVDKVIYWYRNEPIADYGHGTAAELVADGHVEAVYLARAP